MRFAVWLLIFCSASNVFAEVDWPVLNLVGNTRLSMPFRTVITHAGDGSGRLFVAGQAGDIVIVSGGKLQSFLEIYDRVKWDGSSKSEQGFLGVAFPPDFKSKRHFYVNYTRKPGGATVISRFSLSADDNVADASSEQVLLTIPWHTEMHKGGQLAFGPDGYLYIGTGDGGPWFDPDNRAQDTSSLLGKILRIDVEGGQSPYGIPASNPFVNNPAYKPEIWALGLRNPWRFSFDRETGDLFIGDVGQSLREEIDFQPHSSPGGENYGWRIKEGSLDHILPEGGIGATLTLTAPIIEYDRQGGGCIIGGYVYRGTNYPRMKGVYFYGDYVSRRIWGAKQVDGQWKTQELMKTEYAIRTFGEDEEGNLYFADGGQIYKIEDTGKIEPVTLGVKGASSQSGPIKLEWASAIQRNYQVQSSEDLGAWSNLGVALKGTGASLSVEVEVGSKSRFYRVLAVPAPVI